MQIEAIAVRNYRSLKAVDLAGCSEANVLIGKNNSGKSNILTAIAIAVGQLRCEEVSSSWPRSGRDLDQFFARDASNTISIGIQFSLASTVRDEILALISEGVPGVEVARASASSETSLVVIVAGSIVGGILARYISEIGFGELIDVNGRPSASGLKVFSASQAVSAEMVEQQRKLDDLQADSKTLDRIETEVNTRSLWQERARQESRYYLRQHYVEFVDEDLQGKVESALHSSSNALEFSGQLNQVRAALVNNLDQIQSRPTTKAFTIFSGNVNNLPKYFKRVLRYIGETEILHFKETRNPIGPEEAAYLLRLKTTRGGPEKLLVLQEAVRSLLGVSIDAFEAENLPRRRLPQRSSDHIRDAEMDIDNFLVEANGAGIREALRIILDISSKDPDLVLIEEPEVHLHPGLEKLVHTYLIQKSARSQIFVATHSTNFLDVSALQNIYVVSRNDDSGTIIERVAHEDDVLKIPSEIGLRPSTVFMFNKLVFVEGITDEDVLIALAQKLGFDVSSRNVGFVRMGGGSNMSYFASDATMDLLSKRQIPMIFVVDSDERSSSELEKIKSRFGERAAFHPLRRRELENYLVDAKAIRSLIAEKASTSKEKSIAPSIEEIERVFKSAALSLQKRVVELRINRELLNPIYPDRCSGVSPQEKIDAAQNVINQRKSDLQEMIKSVEKAVEADWESKCLLRAPGSDVLSETMKEFGFAYRKERDAARLAALIDKDDVALEMKELIRKIASA